MLTAVKQSVTVTYRQRSWHPHGSHRQRYRCPWVRRSGRTTHRLARHFPPLGTSPSYPARLPSTAATKSQHASPFRRRPPTYISDEQLLVLCGIVRRTSKTSTESTSTGKRCASEWRFAHSRTDLTGNRSRAESGLGFSVLWAVMISPTFSKCYSGRTSRMKHGRPRIGF